MQSTRGAPFDLLGSGLVGNQSDMPSDFGCQFAHLLFGLFGRFYTATVTASARVNLCFLTTNIPPVSGRSSSATSVKKATLVAWHRNAVPALEGFRLCDNCSADLRRQLSLWIEIYHLFVPQIGSQRLSGSAGGAVDSGCASGSILRYN